MSPGHTTAAAHDNTSESDEKHKIITAVSDELSALSEKHAALQGMIKPLLTSRTLDAQHLIEVQNVDIVSQHLTELSKFLAHYLKHASNGEGDSVVVAIDAVALSELAQRLSSVCLGAQLTDKTHNPVELF